MAMAKATPSKLMKRLASMIPDEEIDARMDEIDEQMAELGRERNALDMAKRTRLLALSALHQDVKPENIFIIEAKANGNADKPSIRAALRAIFTAHPTGTMNMNEIMEVLKARGWVPDGDDPRKLVGAAISGMVHRSGELEPTGERATYRRKQSGSGSGNDPLTLDGVSGS